eukprot:8857039-Pyramimonas_sp.AAC.1
MSARKRAAIGKGIFDTTKPEDAVAAKEVFEERRKSRQQQELSREIQTEDGNVTPSSSRLGQDDPVNTAASFPPV